jgi:hypothetical protein
LFPGDIQNQIVDYISHGRERVYTAKFAIHTFVAKSVADRGQWFDCLKPDIFGNNF